MVVILRIFSGIRIILVQLNVASTSVSIFNNNINAVNGPNH